MSYDAIPHRHPTLRTCARSSMTSTRTSRSSRCPRPTTAEMMMIFFMSKEVQIDEMLLDDKYIDMIRREVTNSFQRDRARRNDVTLNDSLFIGIILPQSFKESYVLTYVIMNNNASDSE
eukprot:3356644-Heterocapsa_arctica.AAC.1